MYLTWYHIDPQLVWSRCPKISSKDTQKWVSKSTKYFLMELYKIAIIYSWWLTVYEIVCFWWKSFSFSLIVSWIKEALLFVNLVDLSWLHDICNQIFSFNFRWVKEYAKYFHGSVRVDSRKSIFKAFLWKKDYMTRNNSLLSSYINWGHWILLDT